MERLSRPTGGRAFFTERADELHNSFNELLEELSHQHADWVISRRTAQRRYVASASRSMLTASASGSRPAGVSCARIIEPTRSASSLVSAFAAARGPNTHHALSLDRCRLRSILQRMEAAGPSEHGRRHPRLLREHADKREPFQREISDVSFQAVIGGHHSIAIGVTTPPPDARPRLFPFPIS